MACAREKEEEEGEEDGFDVLLSCTHSKSMGRGLRREIHGAIVRVRLLL